MIPLQKCNYKNRIKFSHKQGTTKTNFGLKRHIPYTKSIIRITTTYKLVVSKGLPYKYLATVHNLNITILNLANTYMNDIDNSLTETQP